MLLAIPPLPCDRATAIVNVARVIAFALALFSCLAESEEGKMRRA